MRTDYDVVVVGADPAGCAAAYDLATAGRRVLLVDRFAPHQGLCRRIDRQDDPRAALFGRTRNLRKSAEFARLGAAGLVDPLFGEGIDYAVVSGQAAAAIIEGSQYEKKLRRIQRDPRVCRNYARLFYGDPKRWYPLLTSAIGGYAMTRGVVHRPVLASPEARARA